MKIDIPRLNCTATILEDSGCSITVPIKAIIDEEIKSPLRCPEEHCDFSTHSAIGLKSHFKRKSGPGHQHGPKDTSDKGRLSYAMYNILNIVFLGFVRLELKLDYF